VNHGTLSHGNALMLGAIRNGISSHERYSSSHSKTHRAAMGFSLRSTGCVKRPKECWNESRTIEGGAGSKDQRKTRRREPAGAKPKQSGGLNRLPTCPRRFVVKAVP